MVSITEVDCTKALKSKLGHEDFVLEAYTLKPSNKRLGFSSSQTELTVVVQVHGQTEIHKFFVKYFNQENVRMTQDYIFRHKLNVKEFDVFHRIIPDFEYVALKRIAPKCYYGVPDRFLIFEHLSDSGFEMNRLPEVDENHAFIGIETLAHFHALSFVKERQWNVCLGEKYKDFLYESFILILEDDPESCYLYGADQRLRCIMKECLEDFKDVDGYVDGITRKFADLVKPSHQFKNVICHGDCWANNIMYKYDENGLPVDSILIDYQVLRFVPPAHDLVYFTRMNIGPELRRTHEKRLLTHYYDALKTYLSKHGINAHDVLPESELHESFKYFNEQYGTLAKAYFIIPGLPMEYWPKLFGDDALMFETLSKGNVPALLEILNDSPGFKEEMRTRLLDVLKYHEAEKL